MEEILLKRLGECFMSKRLLVVGSSSIHLFNFIKLVERYFDEVLLLSNKKVEEWEIATKEVDFSMRKGGYRNFKNLQTIIKEFNPTVVHLHQADTKSLLTLLALRKFAVKKILTAWGSDILLSPKQSLWTLWRVKYILRHVDAVTADSNTVLDEAERLVGSLNRYRINFGIEMPCCDGKKEDIVYSNRLHKKLYNIDKIILSFSNFLKTSPSWKLVLAGSGEEQENLKALVKKLGIEKNVEFIGWVDSQINYEYYCKAKIYVSIPQSDSISLSLVEAIASGCVVFVSDLLANREVVSEEIGFIIPDDKLQTIPFNDYLKIPEESYIKAQGLIVQAFSKEYNREAYIKLYEESIVE